MDGEITVTETPLRLVVSWGRYLPATSRYAQVPEKFDVGHVADRLAEYCRTEQEERDRRLARRERVGLMDAVGASLEKEAGVDQDQAVRVVSDAQGTSLCVYLEQLPRQIVAAVLKAYVAARDEEDN